MKELLVQRGGPDGSIRRLARGQRGLSLIEAMIATSVFLFIAAATWKFVGVVQRQSTQGEARIDIETQGRQAIELILDDIRYAGYYAFNNDGADATNTRQHSLIVTGNHMLAFYADRYPDIWSPMDAAGMPVDAISYRLGSGSEWTKFPNLYAVRFPDPDGGAMVPTDDGPEYFEQVATMLEAGQEVPDFLRRTAEVIVYSLDANDDGILDSADKQMFESALTLNPSDIVLRRRVIGTRLVGGTPAWHAETATVATHVRTYTESGDLYPDGSKPLPLFVYTISDMFGNFDFDNNGRENEFIFGDCLGLDAPGCGDGVLSAAEIDNLYEIDAMDPPDIIEQFAKDARLAGVLARIRLRFPEMTTDADAQQFIRDCISSVRVNLVTVQSERSVDTRQFLQHDLSADVYLPNAFMLSKNQLFSAANLLSYELNDGGDGWTGEFGKVYDENKCPPPSSCYEPNACWPSKNGPPVLPECTGSEDPGPTPTPAACGGAGTVCNSKNDCCSKKCSGGKTKYCS
jgi:hypothetical protein